MKDVKKIILLRLYLVYFFTLIFSIVIIGKIINIQVVQGKEWREISVKRNFAWRDIKAKRGNIYSSDGFTICQPKPIYDIYMDPLSDGISDTLFNNNINALGDSLHKHFNIDKRTFLSEIKAIRNRTARINRHYLIKKNISWEEFMFMSEFPIFKNGRLKGGFIYYENYVTDYPYGTLAQRTIGNANEIRGVKFGLNGHYDKELTGTIGKQYVQRIRGTGWYPVNNNTAKRIKPINGYDLITTISVRVQDLAEKELKNRILRHDADSGCIVIMDVKTGHVRAIANLKQLSNGTVVEELNYAVSTLFDPGSTMKLPTLMTAYEDGYIDITDTIDCGSGRIKLYGKTYEDVRRGGYGKISVRDIFKESSNVGVVEIIERHYNSTKNKSRKEIEKQRQKFVDGLYRMGLNQRVNSEIENEPHPTIRNTGFSNISLLQMAIGYEIAMTPLQLLTFYNAVANDGVMVKPMFATEIKDGARTVKRFETTVLNKEIAKPKTIEFARELLEAVVKEGTAKGIRNTKYYSIAGKTGTTKAFNDSLGYNHSQFYNSTFVGYFPTDEPKYSVVVVLYNPKVGGYHGGAVAAPVVKEIADKIYAMEIGVITEHDIVVEKTKLPITVGNQKDLDVIYAAFNKNIVSENPNSSWVVCEENNRVTIFKTHLIDDETTPNVVGMSLKDALYILENKGFKVSYKGVGTVKKQSVPHGQPIQNNNMIVLTLSI